MLALPANLLTDNMTLAQGVETTMAELGHDPHFDAYLKLYPADSGDSRVHELIKYHGRALARENSG